jgi:hypothetical protein
MCHIHHVGVESQDLVFDLGDQCRWFTTSRVTFCMEPTTWSLSSSSHRLKFTSNTAPPASSSRRIELHRNNAQLQPSMPILPPPIQCSAHQAEKGPSSIGPFILGAGILFPEGTAVSPFLTPCASNTHTAREGDEQENTFCDFIK